ncbi:hypothetical protein ACFE04_027638 [Oxalis oulophora]
MSSKKRTLSSKVEHFEEEETQHSILDLPDLAFECILDRLPPSGLCSMAGVCSSLREKCTSDHLWEKHMKLKWGRVVGQHAYRGWHRYLGSRNDSNNDKLRKHVRLLRLLFLVRPFSWIRSRIDDINSKHSYLPDNSIMSWYIALETGKFWFPAQIYNRENGHVGFMLSCYDAEVSYDSRTDTFQARYPPHGRRAIAVENCVPWERLRAPPVDTPPHDLHDSDCLNELKPGDHIEIQWRRNKDFPYGLFLVGGMALSVTMNRVMEIKITVIVKIVVNTVVLEFNQYTPGSRWRITTVNRKEHKEEGNNAHGFYGGIRKLESEDEISIWKRLWPTDILE